MNKACTAHYERRNSLQRGNRPARCKQGESVTVFQRRMDDCGGHSRGRLGRGGETWRTNALRSLLLYLAVIGVAIFHVAPDQQYLDEQHLAKQRQSIARHAIATSSHSYLKAGSCAGSLGLGEFKRSYSEKGNKNYKRHEF